MPAQRFLMAARGLLAALALALAPAAAEAQIGTKAGVAAAVRGPVQQISYRSPEASVGRTLAGEQEIFLGDRIVTGPGGGLQILLLDGTTFSLGPNTKVFMLVHDEKPVLIELPATVELTVTDTPPGIKGATVTNQLKEATMETGLKTRVPAFIEIGETLKISTEDGSYMSRA